MVNLQIFMVADMTGDKKSPLDKTPEGYFWTRFKKGSRYIHRLVKKGTQAVLPFKKRDD